jgi:choline dehydrogenase
MVAAVGDWSPTLEAVGVPTTSDASGGQTYGSFVATSAINPSNWTRSYARAAYLDSLPNRPNLAVLPMNTVTRIIFSGNSSDGSLIASQVEYATAAGAAKKTVNVNKEVILTGGAIGSPQILMLSGVGPPDVLQAAGVPVNLPLPGVGQHLQDHLVRFLPLYVNTVSDVGFLCHSPRKLFGLQAGTLILPSIMISIAV